MAARSSLRSSLPRLKKKGPRVPESRRGSQSRSIVTGFAADRSKWFCGRKKSSEAGRNNRKKNLRVAGYFPGGRMIGWLNIRVDNYPMDDFLSDDCPLDKKRVDERPVTGLVHSCRILTCSSH